MFCFIARGVSFVWFTSWIFPWRLSLLVSFVSRLCLSFSSRILVVSPCVFLWCLSVCSPLYIAFSFFSREILSRSVFYVTLSCCLFLFSFCMRCPFFICSFFFNLFFFSPDFPLVRVYLFSPPIYSPSDGSLSSGLQRFSPFFFPFI